MATDYNANIPKEVTAQDLSMKNSLNTQKPLGHKFINPKFLSPLGTKLLSNLGDSVNRTSVGAANKSTTKNTNTSINTSVVSAETTVVQPKTKTQHQNHQTEIPQLPTGLQKISTLSPLAQQSDLITSTFANQTTSRNSSTSISVSAFPPVQMRKKSAKEPPNSWSSIAELADKITKVDHNPRVVVQPLNSKRSHYSPQAIHYPKSNNSSQIIQTSSSPSSSTSVQNIEDSQNEVTITHETSQEEYENLELLAKEIYKMLQQRLKIEQERRGKNYLGRLPW
ncbi:hypothetical protein I8748_01750 [Nostoc sp. CENA67]|uniref:Uncharacterized protein n=1 Tax=Amazonocrinis nigriterrae CENA67 TaxID=2794033 RepID=A0A8J7HP96_9NOST|nr:hypothetical protein [Amazonocrinis nigriterrae]MBH8560915.1 hypothetical protein [Amazonocrinis nigriterrae CENA67]